MAGIWDRITGDDPIPGHILPAAVRLSVLGVFTNAQILAAINAKLATALSTAAETDLTNIRTQAAAGSATNRVEYRAKLEALMVAVEQGMLTNEATFRSQLSIP